MNLASGIGGAGLASAQGMAGHRSSTRRVLAIREARAMALAAGRHCLLNRGRQGSTARRGSMGNHDGQP